MKIKLQLVIISRDEQHYLFIKQKIYGFKYTIMKFVIKSTKSLTTYLIFIFSHYHK